MHVMHDALIKLERLKRHPEGQFGGRPVLILHIIALDMPQYNMAFGIHKTMSVFAIGRVYSRPDPCGQ